MIIILKHLEVYGINIEMNNVLSNGAIADFPAADNNSTLFKLKKIKNSTQNKR